MKAIILLVVTTILSIAQGFHVSNNGKRFGSVSRLQMSYDKRWISKASAGLMGIFLIGSTFTAPVFVQPAFAEFRAAQKRTYFRFVPKIVSGRDFYKNELKQAIDKEDWKVVEKIFEEYVTKYNPNFPDQVDATDTYVQSTFFRPMTVLAGSFAERGSSPKQRALTEQLEVFEKAINKLESSVRVTKGEGFFAADVQPPTGAEKKKKALEAWQEGKTALNNYIQIVNSGLMQELNAIEPL
eukprot:gene8246-16962_t